MMFCSQCGNKQSDQENFCRSCGAANCFASSQSSTTGNQMEFSTSTQKILKRYSVFYVELWASMFWWACPSMVFVWIIFVAGLVLQLVEPDKYFLFLFFTVCTSLAIWELYRMKCAAKEMEEKVALTLLTKKSEGRSIYELLIREKDPIKLWKYYYHVMIFNFVFSASLHWFGFFKYSSEYSKLEDILYSFFGVAIIIGIIYFLIKILAINRQKRNWVLLVIAFYFGLVLYQFNDGVNYSPSTLEFMAYSNKNYLFTHLIVFWEFIGGSVIEVFILLKIFKNINRSG